jgi:hypothetical protein
MGHGHDGEKLLERGQEMGETGSAKAGQLPNGTHL